MRRLNSFFIYFFVFLLVLSSVLAVKPSPQVSSDIASILYPKESVFGFGNNISLHFHFSNSSNRILNNSLFNCYGHIYDTSNEHISIQELVNEGSFDKVANIDSSSLLVTGLYSYNVWCNSSSQAAFVSDGFYVNNSGNLEDNNDWLAIGVILVLLASIFFYSSFIIKSEKLQMLKILFFVFGAFTLFFTGAIPYFITLNPNDIMSFKDVAEGFAIIYIIGFLAFVFMYGYHLIINIGKNGEGKDKE